jgi:hypothetical protein
MNAFDQECLLCSIWFRKKIQWTQNPIPLHLFGVVLQGSNIMNECIWWKLVVLYSTEVKKIQQTSLDPWISVENGKSHLLYVLSLVFS